MSPSSLFQIGADESAVLALEKNSQGLFRAVMVRFHACGTFAVHQFVFASLLD